MMNWLRIGLMVVVALVLTAQPAQACLWDRDTLATEAKGLPEVPAIIVGRFERNPPKYYEMRLERVTAVLEKTPGDVAALDDAAVACDRLGRQDDAIAWMAKKRAQLDQQPDKEHEYRYLANLGTFHVHRWFAKGAKRDDMADLERGRDFIEKAIGLNPNAHFGREKVQLQVIKWIIEQPLHDPGHSEAVKPLLPPPDSELSTAAKEEAVRGLIGLIALGAAWQSVDMFAALGEQLAYNGHNSLARLAELRVQELEKAGKKSVHAPRMVSQGIPARGLEDDQLAAVAKAFKDGRAAAEQWHAQRLSFMQAKFEHGEHPDTHADFWKGYQDEPKLPVAMATAKHGGCGSCALGTAPEHGQSWLWLLALVLPLRRSARGRAGAQNQKRTL